jgi:hypothetical protein
MIFRKKIEPRCAYCTHCRVLTEREVACRYRGVVPASAYCGRFRYDPIKRIPPPPVQLRGGYSPDDFRIR